MNLKSPILAALLVFAPAVVAADEKPRAVIVVGTHHYAPQKTMPLFAAELERLGFQTTVLNPAWDPEKDRRGLPGLEALADADVAVFYTRFLKLNDEQLRPITSYLGSGKPVVGFRTSTHGFNYADEHPQHDLNDGFGRDALGSPYLIHLSSSTKIELAKGAAIHPILTGVDSTAWRSPGTLYLTRGEPGVKPLLVGTGNSKRVGEVKNRFGTHQLEKTMTDTVAWTWKNKWGGRTFTTSLGHAGDFAVPQSIRVMVNGVFWAAGLDVPDAKTTIKTFTVGNGNREARQNANANRKAAGRHKTQPPEHRLDARGLTILYGNSFVERLQEDGTLEAMLQAATPDKRLRFRSMAYSGDEVGFRIRPAKFGDHLGYISRQLPCDRVVMCFGMNESFAGANGLAEFEENLAAYLKLIEERHPGSERILVSPIAVERSDAGDFPDPVQRNADIAMYTGAMERIAKTQGIRYVDLFSASAKLFEESTAPLTENGLHLNEKGNQAIAKILAGALSTKKRTEAINQKAPGFESLRQLVSRKAYEVAMAYKPANGIHYYGLRARDYEYAAEIPHHLKLASQLDEVIWKQAQDLNETQAFPKLTTVEASPPPRAPRRGLGMIKTTAEDMQDFTVAEEFALNLFASSEQFPNLINPLQMQFDARGRLWVCTFESYPVPLPGELSNDKILIFEGTDDDGKADKETVFADGLKLPDGFVFYKDGIIVSVARKLEWLRDTDGDDVADLHDEWLRGADDTDTHHGGYLARTPQGDIILNEALFHRGQFETPHGPVRTKNAATLHLNPITRKLTIERQTTHPNPWKVSYNRHGESLQMFGGGQIIDCDFYNVATPVGVSSSSDMGMPFRDDKGCTLAFVSGEHFPKEWERGIVTGHLLGKNAVLYTPLKVDGGTLVKASSSQSLLTSSNKSFRPVDLKFGLDGALYISDFYYPIIGHAQHSIRDANRDYSNGRIWRLIKKDTALAPAPRIAGAELPELFELLTHPLITAKELARYELEKRSDAEVLAFAKTKVSAAVDNEELGLELLWLFERLRDFSQKELFLQLVASKDLAIRRAAAKSIRAWAPSLGAEAKAIAQALLQSDDDRTKVSLISALSFLQTQDLYWVDIIQNIAAPNASPIDRMKTLAALMDAPPLSPEFPLLKVSPEANLEGWLAGSKKLGGAIYLKSDQAQTVILGYLGNPYMNVDANGIPLLRATGSQHSKDGQISVDLQRGINKIEYFSEHRGKPMKGATNLYLANLVGEKPAGVRIAPTEAEHQTWAKSWEDRYATVTDDRIYIKAIPSQLAFNVKTFTVKPGREYRFVFENPDHMLHNLVITQPGKGTTVGELSDEMATQPDAMTNHFVPESAFVLYATPQIPHGGKHESTFKTPEQPGRYPYICTFPGHWRLMRIGSPPQRMISKASTFGSAARSSQS